MEVAPCLFPFFIYFNLPPMEDPSFFLGSIKSGIEDLNYFYFLNLSSTLSDGANGSYIYENLNIFLAVSKKKKNLFLAQYIIIFLP